MRRRHARRLMAVSGLFLSGSEGSHTDSACRWLRASDSPRGIREEGYLIGCNLLDGIWTCCSCGITVAFWLGRAVRTGSYLYCHSRP